MAKYVAGFGNEVLKEMQKVSRDADKIFGAMTRAGAEVVKSNVIKNCPIPDLCSHVKLSKTYKTPSDDGINTKVYFSGYLPFRIGKKFPRGGRKQFVRRGRAGSKKYETNKGVPADFVAQVTEYGTSERYTDSKGERGFVDKRPFFRKSFRKAQIERAMLKVQKQESGGILE